MSIMPAPTGGDSPDRTRKDDRMFEAQVSQLIEARKKNANANGLFVQVKRTGKKAEIAEAFKQVVDFDPTWIEAQYHYGIALIRIAKHKEALGSFLACAASHPKWISALYHLGLCHLKTGNASIAISIFKGILNLDYKDDVTEYSKNFETLGDHYFSIARAEKSKKLRDDIILELKSICESEIKKNGDQPWSVLYIGAIEFYFNNVTDSLRSFEKASNLADPMQMDKPFLFRSAYGCYSTKSFLTLNSILTSPRKIQEPVISLGQAKQRDLVFLIGCDDGYFNRFASSFLGTLYETNDNLTVHFHIIGDESSISEKRKSLALELRKDRKISLEYSFEKKPAHGNKTYYALSRFVIASKIINHYKCGLIIGDIDAAVIGNLRQVKEHVGNNDVGVDTNFSAETFRKFPWNSISGCYLYINNTKLGNQFATSMSHLMLDVFDPESPKTWWLDQSLLYCVTFYMQNHAPGFKPASLIGEKAPKPFMYSIPGKSKDDFSKSLVDNVRSGEFTKKYA